MSLFDYQAPNKHTLILFLRTDCEFCAQAQKLVEEVTIINILTYIVINSRISDKLEIRPIDQKSRNADFPLLVDADDIPNVPCLFDPSLGQRMLGLPAIEKYLEDTGLLDC